MQTFEANMNQAISDFRGIKNKIIECGVEVAEGTPTSRYADKVGEVFEAGKAQGGDPIATFMEIYQDHGNRINYQNGFSGIGWNRETFKPKYNMKPKNAYMMFRGIKEEIDLVDWFENLGVTVDFSQCTDFNYVFSTSLFTRIGVIDATAAKGNINNAFQSCTSLITIEKIIMPNIVVTTNLLAATFQGCEALENITFEGTICIGGLDLHWSTKLTAESYHSLITALSNETTGKTVTFTAYDTVKTVYDTKYGDGAWDAIVATKPNWTIAYS